MTELFQRIGKKISQTFTMKGPGPSNMLDKIILIEVLVFILPLACLLYVIHQGQYDLRLSNAVIFMSIASFILAGMLILRRILNSISRIAASFKTAAAESPVSIDIQKDVVELHEITASLSLLLQKQEKITKELEQRTLELSAIRSLADIVSDHHLSLDEQMGLLLEKCMAVTGARVGSVFMVEPETRQRRMASIRSESLLVSQLYHFRVCAAIGQQAPFQKEKLIDIDSSVVKGVLLEKAPLLVSNISKDPRTMKANDPGYLSPSFLSVPIIIGGSVFAVVNLAEKPAHQPFDGNDERIISILSRDVGYIFESAMLQAKLKEQIGKIRKYRTEIEREIERRNRAEKVLGLLDPKPTAPDSP